MNPQIHHNRRRTISTPITRLRVIPDWPHDIYTLRGSPVARDRGSAQWQVFYWGRVEKYNLNLTHVWCALWFILGCIYRRIWHCHTCVFGLILFKWPPQGWSEARHLKQSSLACCYLNTVRSVLNDANPLARKATAHGLFPCFSGRIGS